MVTHNDVIHKRLKICDTIMKDYGQSLIEQKALKTLKIQSKCTEDDIIAKNNMANEVASIKNVEMTWFMISDVYT